MNVWIKYFSDKTRAETKDGFKGQPELERFYDVGKISGFPQHEITKQVIEGEKTQTVVPNLSTYFSLSRPLKSHIFDMCKVMFTARPEAIAQKIVDSYFVTLMRTFIIFASKFDYSQVQLLLDGQELPHNFGPCLDNFHFLVKALLLAKSEVRNDFLFLFRDVTSVYFSAAGNIIPARENPLSKSVYNLLDVFVEFLKKITADEKLQLDQAKCFDAVYQFVFQFFWHWIESGDADAMQRFWALCRILASKSELTAQCSGAAYSWIVSTLKMVLEKVQGLEPNVDSYHVCYNTAMLLSELMPLESERTKGDWDIVETMEHLFDWVSGLEPLDFGEVDDTLQYDKEMNRNWNIAFVNEELISNDLCIGEFEVSGRVYPLINQTALSTYNLVFLFKNMCSRVPELRRKFLQNIVGDDSKRVQYLAMTWLSLFYPVDRQMESDMEDCWCRFVNRFAFHRGVEANPLRSNLRELTVHFIVDCWKCFDKLNIILDAFGDLLSPLEPQTVSYCVRLLGFLLRMEHDKFMNAVINSKVVDALIRCDFVYLNWQLEGMKDNVIKDVRGQILAFFVEMACNTNMLLFIFQNEQRIMFAISWAFEEISKPFGLDVLKKGLQQTKSIGLVKCLTKVIAQGLPSLHHDGKWQEFVMGVIRDSILHAVTTNYKNIVDSFLNVGDYAPVAIFAKIPISSKGSGQEEEFIKGVLDIFRELCSKSPVMLRALMNESWHFKNSMIEGIKSSEFTDKILLTLLSFVFNINVTSLTMLKGNNDLFIWNVVALEILFNLTLGSQFEKDTLSILFGVCAHSIANRFQCYRAGLLTHLIGLKDDYSVNLVTKIGTYFLSVHNLSMLLKIVNQSDVDFAVVLIDSLTSMKRMNKESTPHQCFYLGQTDAFLETDQFDMPRTYSLQFCVQFSNIESSSQRRIFLEICRGEQKIILYKKSGRDMDLEVFQNGRHVCDTVPTQLVVNQWHEFVISVSTSHIRVFVDSQEVINIKTSHKLEHRMKGAVTFRGPNTYLHSVAMRANSVTDTKSISKLEEVMQFAPNTKDGDDCANLDGISPKARFTGLPIYYLTDIASAIAICGGPNVLLPLIQREDLTEKMLLSFLGMIKELIVRNMMLFKSRKFFRSFGYVFDKINQECVSFAVIELLYEIFECLKIDALKVEMTKFVWGNFDRWFSLDVGLRISIFSGIFGMLIDDPLFRTNLSFSDLLLKFTPRLSQEQNEEMMDRCNKLLHCYGQKENAMSTTDAAMLIGAAMFHKNKGKKGYNMLLHELNLIKDLSTEFVQPINAILQQCEFVNFYNFFLDCDNRAIIELTLDCIRIIVTAKDRLGSKDSDAVMIRSLKFLPVAFCDQQMTDKLLAMMSENDSFQLDHPAPILYPQFLPLFVKVVQRVENREVYVNHVLKLYSSDSPISRKALKAVQYWCFWMLLLYKSCSDESHLDDWISAIANCVWSLIKESREFQPEPWFKQLYVFCVILQIDFATITCLIFKKLSRDERIGFTPELAVLLSHFLI